MQALKALGLALLLSPLPLFAQHDWSKVDLGEFTVPAACPGVDLVARAKAPQQQRQAAVWDSGMVSLSMRAWPDRPLRDRQSIKAFDGCAKSAQQRVPAAQLGAANGATEEALLVAINQCLVELQRPIRARTVVVSRGSTRCPG